MTDDVCGVLAHTTSHTVRRFEHLTLQQSLVIIRRTHAFRKRQHRTGRLQRPAMIHSMSRYSESANATQAGRTSAGRSNPFESVRIRSNIRMRRDTVRPFLLNSSAAIITAATE